MSGYRSRGISYGQVLNRWDHIGMSDTVPGLLQGLFPKLLGDSWPRLDETVRRLHGSGTTVRATGVFQVRHGSSWLARVLAWLARLPAAGDAVPVELRVVARADGE